MDETQVEIVVKQGTKHFKIYRGLLCFYSEYFRRAFEGGFLESEDRLIALDDVQEPIFRLFQAWLSSQAARCDDATLAEPLRNRDAPKSLYALEILATEKGDLRNKHYYDVFLELYAFADHYDIPQLRMDILTTMMGYPYEALPLTETLDVERMCALLPETAQLRKYLTNCIMYEWVKNGPSKADMQRLPEEFRMEVLYQVLAFARGNLSNIQKSHLHDPCFYHEHKDERTNGPRRCMTFWGADIDFYSNFLWDCVSEGMRRREAESVPSEST